MRTIFRKQLLCTASLAVVAGAYGSAARADINGFGDFSSFTVNQSDANAAPTVAPGIIHLTNTVAHEQRSVFANTPQPIATFTASFTYQANNTSAFNGSVGGVAFTLQNSPSGAHAVQAASGGITVGTGGITPSVYTTLELISSSATASGYYTNGAAPSGSTFTSPLNLASGDPIKVALSYNGSILQEQLTDTVTAASYSASYLSNIPAILGGSTAYVGVTAANGSQESADQFISNFQFTSAVPEPATAGFAASALLTTMVRRRRRA